MRSGKKDHRSVGLDAVDSLRCRVIGGGRAQEIKHLCLVEFDLLHGCLVLPGPSATNAAQSSSLQNNPKQRCAAPVPASHGYLQLRVDCLWFVTLITILLNVKTYP